MAEQGYYSESVEDHKKDLPSVPPDTCPLIDAVIKAIRNVEKIIARRDRYDSIEDITDEIESEVWGLEDGLEAIRTHNHNLRELGASWYIIAKMLATEADGETRKAA